MSKQRWEAGTLVYTTAGVFALFFFLLLGDFAWSFKERSVPDVFKALLKEFSDNATLLAALAGALPALLTMTLGPVVGAWSDRYRSRYGRRIPFLVATTPIIGVSMVCLAYSVPLGEALHRLLGGGPDTTHVSIIVIMALAWTIFEAATIVGNALFIALINDTVPRRVIGRFFGVFRIFSLGVGASFFYLFFDNGLLDKYRVILLGIAGIYVVGFSVLCVFVREGTYPEPPARIRQPVAARIGSYMNACFSVKFFALLFVVFGIATVSFMPVNINSFNAKDQFGVDKTGFGQSLAITYLISLTLAFPLGWAADRFHPIRMGLATLVLYAVTMIVGYFCVTSPLSFKVVFIAHGVLSGAFFTSTAALLLVLLPRARFSELAAASAALTALMTAILTMSMGGILDLIGRDFRTIFLGGGLVALVGAIGWAWLYREFANLGGIAGYVPPGGDEAATTKIPVAH